jgi:radical SAM superfamily enzyme YgiQ (UPF0313 family)
MKIHLVYPNFQSGNAGGAQEPLGILSLASSLRKAGHRVTFTDMTFQRDISAIDEPVRNADVLGIGCSTSLFGKVVEILNLAKRTNPRLFFIAGGPHATQDPEDALRQGFDAIVMGEAEKSIVDLVNCLDGAGDWRRLSGLAYLKREKVIENPRLEFIQELNALPFVARDLIDQRQYIRKNGYASIFNTRGCPFGCLYCKPMVDKLFGKKTRMRSAWNIAEEIEIMHKEYGANTFYFKDDTLLLCGYEWFDSLRKEFDKRNLRIHWYCLGRVDQINEPLLKCMKAAGLAAIAFGIESGSQKILDFYRKGVTLQQAKTAFSLCHKHNIMTHAYIMLGAPVETRADLQKTLEFLKGLRPHSCRFFITTPIPGNFLYEYAKENNIVHVGSYEGYDYAFNLLRGRLPMKLEQLTIKDILEYSKKMRMVYFSENIKRCFTQWSALIIAFKHLRNVFNITFNRLSMSNSKIIIVLVAYNAEKTLEMTLASIPKGIADEIIFIDDASRDNTLGVARRLNLNIFSHSENKGYGAAQKTGYKEALRRGADIVVLLHADYQYDPRKIPELVRPIIEKRADVVFGSRIMNGGALKGGMPLWKYYANIFTTVLANAVFAMHLTEYHAGFRVYSSNVLRNIDFEKNSNNYVFDAEIIAQIISKNYKIAEIPIPTRYFKEASSIAFWPSVVYGLGFFRILFSRLLMKHKHKNGR